MAENKKNSVSVRKPKKEKKAKVEKKVSAAKLPGLMKKSYTQKKLQKKILSKLYVPGDKDYVASLFEKGADKKGREVYSVPKGKEFNVSEIKRIKILAKEIKANKGTVKLVPLIAVAVFIACVGIAVTAFKNPVAKWGIKSSLQAVFGAKCDIDSVNIEIFGSRITVRNLAQASSSDPMKNLFEFELLDLDFNLSQILRAKFNVENIEITGIKTGTDRKKSGALPVKKKSPEEKEKKTDSTGFYASLEEKAGTSVSDAKNAFAELFAAYNPQNIISNIQENLQTEKVSKEVEEELKVLVENWKNKPAELNKISEDLKSSTAKLTSLDVSSVKTPAEAAAFVKEIESAVSSVKDAKESVSSVMGSFESDKTKISSMQKKMTDAVESDKKLLSDQFSVFDVSKAKNLIGDTINQTGYSLLGKYYPYLKNVISYAGTMKSSASKKSKDKKEPDAVKKAKETAKKESKRYAGRNVYWKKDTVPSLLIEKIHGSGSGIEIFATNISNDMNKRGEPWKISGSLLQGEKNHSADVVIDARDGSSAPLVAAGYSGSNFPMVFDLAKTSPAAGVPKFDGVSNVSAKLTADSDFSFSGHFSLGMSPVTVTAEKLENETAERLYSSALSTIHSLNIGADVGFGAENGVSMNITTDFDRILAEAVSKVAQSELAGAKDAAMKKLSEELSKSTSGADAYLLQLNDISSKLNSSKAGIDSISQALEQKKAELEKQVSGAIDQKKNEIQKQVSDAAKEKAAAAGSSFLKGLKK